MNLSRIRDVRLAALFLLAGLAALYAGALREGFLNDDYLFLEAARAHGAGPAARALANYFRPLSRDVWFGLWTTLAGGQPWVFHAAAFAAFALALALLFDLLAAFASPPAALAGVLYFAALPLQRVNLLWISCNQDLLALLCSLAALALYRRGRDRLALAAYFAALLSKESALPLPALLFGWSVLVEGAAPGRALRRVLVFGLPAALWALGEWRLRAESAAAAQLRFAPGDLAAALLHALGAATGLEDPARLPAALLSAGPSVIALLLLAPLALLWPAAGAAGPAAEPRRAHAAPRFAAAWLVAFALPVWPVAHYWSAYFYTTCVVGAAILVARAAERLTRWTYLVFAMGLLWWHAGSTAIPSFAIAETAWSWTSHLTPFYFERGAVLSRQLRAALRRAVPAPAHGTRFFFATIPPHAGFQMGNGAAIRDLYRDPSLESWFYSQFADSSAGSHPCEFLFWNGVDFERLYARGSERFFQVGTDLLLLRQSAGAIHAFRRGFENRENPADLFYWLGWAQLWNGERTAAEQAWTAFGARDDTTAYRGWLRAARTALEDGDTLSARRRLYEALHAGIGRPEVHAALAELLRRRSPKFALLETQVTVFLKPNDRLARRDLVEGLALAHLDERASAELTALEAVYPEWPSDSIAVHLERLLESRRPEGGVLAHYPRPQGGPR